MDTTLPWSCSEVGELVSDLLAVQVDLGVGVEVGSVQRLVVQAILDEGHDLAC